MAAAATDLLQEVGISTATTLDANYTINDTSITVASTSGWPTATGVTFAIDVVDSAGAQVAGTYNEYVGVVSSATSITSVSHQNGTDRNYSAGATTRVYIPVSAERENRIVEWGTTQHKQSGAHGAVTADSLATNTISEGTAASGVTVDGLNIKDGKLNTNNSVVTANMTDLSVTNAKLASQAWQSWTPTLTNLTLGNGSSVGTYIQIGKTVFFKWIFTIGTTSAVGTAPTISLPVTSVATPDVTFPLGTCIYDNNGGSGYNGLFMWASTTTTALYTLDTSNNFTAYSATNPTAYASGHKIYGQGVYEAA